MRILIFLILTLATANLALASVAVSPTHLYITEAQSTATLRLANQSNKLVTFQAQVYKWRQHKKTLVSNVIVSPPIFTIKPHETQIIRFGFLNIKPNTYQQTYRVLLRQLPFGTHSEKQQKTMQLKILLDISVPLLVQPSTPILKTLKVSLVKANDNVYFQIKNTGNVYLYFTSLKIKTSKRKQIKIQSRENYVLPNSTEKWLIPISGTQFKGNVHFKLDTNWKSYDGELTIGHVKNLEG